MNKILKLLIVSCLIVSFVVDAALLRRGGRGSETSTSPNTYYLIDDSWVVLDPDGFPTLNANTYDDAFSASPGKSTTSGKYKLLVVPFDGCAEEYSFGDYDGVPPDFLPVWDGCDWEFTEDERLFAYGDFPLYLDGAFDYDIKFTISSATGDTWVLDGSDTYVDTTGGTALPDGGTSNKGMVFLDAVRPTDLGPGDYTISVSVEMLSGADKTFFHYRDGHSSLNVNCEPTGLPAPDDFFCFVSGGLDVSDSLSFSADFSETLRILPGIVKVSAPATGLILFSSLGILVLRRRRQFENAISPTR